MTATSAPETNYLNTLPVSAISFAVCKFPSQNPDIDKLRPCAP